MFLTFNIIRFSQRIFEFLVCYQFLRLRGVRVKCKNVEFLLPSRHKPSSVSESVSIQWAAIRVIRKNERVVDETLYCQLNPHKIRKRGNIIVEAAIKLR